MNTRNSPPGTLLLASSPCPFCGTPALSRPAGNRVFPAGWIVECGAENGECEVTPRVWKVNQKKAEAAWCRRAK